MEPELELPHRTITNIFEFFDVDKDTKVTLDEISSFVPSSSLTKGYHPGHKQIHIGLTSSEHEMQVMWVSNP